MFQQYLGEAARAGSGLENELSLHLGKVAPKTTIQPGFRQADPRKGIQLSLGKPVPLVSEIVGVALHINEARNPVYDGVTLRVAQQLVSLMDKRCTCRRVP